MGDIGFENLNQLFRIETVNEGDIYMSRFILEGIHFPRKIGRETFVFDIFRSKLTLFEVLKEFFLIAHKEEKYLHDVNFPHYVFTHKYDYEIAHAEFHPFGVTYACDTLQIVVSQQFNEIHSVKASEERKFAIRRPSWIIAAEKEQTTEQKFQSLFSDEESDTDSGEE